MSTFKLVEQASPPAAPAAGNVALYGGTDGVLRSLDSAGGTAALAGAVPGLKTVSVAGSQVANGSVVMSHANFITWGMVGSTITARIPNVSFVENQGAPIFANSAATNSAAPNVSIQRFAVPLAMAVTQLDYLAHLTVVGSQAYSSTMALALYTMSGSTAGTVYTASGTNNAAAAQYTNHSGTRWRSVPLGTWNLAPGEYLLAFAHSLQGPAGTTGSVSIFGESNIALNPNPGGAAVTDYFAEGIITNASSIPPATVELSQINGSAPAAGAMPYFRMVGTF